MMELLCYGLIYMYTTRYTQSSDTAVRCLQCWLLQCIRSARKRANSIKRNKQRMLHAVHLVQRVWRGRSANWRWHIKHIKAKQAAEHVCNCAYNFTSVVSKCATQIEVLNCAASITCGDQFDAWYNVHALSLHRFAVHCIVRHLAITRSR
jgi:hypothetical protein